MLAGRQLFLIFPSTAAKSEQGRRVAHGQRLSKIVFISSDSAAAALLVLELVLAFKKIH